MVMGPVIKAVLHDTCGNLVQPTNPPAHQPRLVGDARRIVVEPPVGFEPTTPALQERKGPLKQLQGCPNSAGFSGLW